MFGKLLKHEFHATARIALPLCGMMLALAVLAGMVLRINGDNVFSAAVRTILILYGLSLFAVSVGIFIILMQRYKQNFFGDEGYLTRTLPVSEHALLLSKLVTALCWYLISGILMALSALLAGGLTGEMSWTDLRDILDAALRVEGNILGYTILGALGGAILLTLLFYATATIAQNFHKHRLLYYFMVVVIFIALIRFLTIFNLLFGVRTFEPASSVGIIGGADGPTSIFVTGNAHWIGLIELYLSDVALYFMTWAFLKYRPNLE